MDSFFQALNSLLALLPLNGYKTQIGAGLSVLAVIAPLVPQIALVTPVVQGLAAIVSGIGLVHGFAKSVVAAKAPVA